MMGSALISATTEATSGVSSHDDQDHRRIDRRAPRPPDRIADGDELKFSGSRAVCEMCIRDRSQFAQYFAALLLSKQASYPPTYKLNVTTNQGAKIVLAVPQ